MRTRQVTARKAGPWELGAACRAARRGPTRGCAPQGRRGHLPRGPGPDAGP